MAIGKRYRAEHIAPGLVGYPEDPEAGTILVTQEALDQMRKTFIGKPVVSFAHSEVSPENLLDFTKNQKEEIAVGVVADAGKNPETGWDYVDMVIWDEETQKLIDEKGYSVSNAYQPQVTEEGGTSAGVPFDHELVDGEYLHMAIVDNPRYEKARIFANSIPEEDRNMFFTFGKKKPEDTKVVKNAAPEAPKPDPKPEMKDLTDAVVNMDGKDVPIADMVNAYKAACASEKSVENQLDPEDLIEIDGKQVPVADLIAAFKSQSEGTMENAEAPQDIPAESVVDETKQGAFANAAPKRPVVNQSIKNSFNATEIPKTQYKTKEDRIAMGKARYGSAVKQEGK